MLFQGRSYSSCYRVARRYTSQDNSDIPAIQMLFQGRSCGSYYKVGTATGQEPLLSRREELRKLKLTATGQERRVREG